MYSSLKVWGKIFICSFLDFDTPGTPIGVIFNTFTELDIDNSVKDHFTPLSRPTVNVGISWTKKNAYLEEGHGCQFLWIDI